MQSFVKQGREGLNRFELDFAGDENALREAGKGTMHLWGEPEHELKCVVQAPCA
jgi:hypothetical protein